MRYSILGFSQKMVCSLTKTIKRDGKADSVLKLDMTDLLILRQLADFPNRKKTKKQIVDDKLFFWVDYKELLEELPILDIKKQALRDRLDKMVELKVLEKVVVNFDRLGSATCFRMGDNYETLLYSDNTKQSTTQGCVADYTWGGSELHDKNNSIEIPKETNTKKEEKLSKKKDFDFLAALLGIGIEEQIAKDWMKIRTSKKASDSETAFKQLHTALETIKNTHRISFNEAISICVTNGWYGCKPSYFDNIKLTDYGIGTQTSLFQQNNGKEWQ